jgi:hypothetical protein
MHIDDLTEDELIRLAAFALGCIAGLILLGLAISLLEEWVIASDTADRRRIREILREMLDPGDPAAPASSSIPAIHSLPYPEMTPH